MPLLTLNFSSNTPKLKVQSLFSTLIKIYGIHEVSLDRKKYIDSLVSKYGYIPYPHYRVLDEMSENEIVYSLYKIYEELGVLDKNGEMQPFKNTSPLSRLEKKDSSWFTREGHNIKLVSLEALGDGNKSEDTASFIQMLAQLITLPKGNPELNIMADTLYLIPFHPREFGCAYLPSSSEVSSKILDKRVEKFLGLNVKEQVQFFIALTQLAGHPVIYDVLPQTGRFSKIVLSNPYVARWNDINELIRLYAEEARKASDEFKFHGEFDRELINSVLDKYIQIINGANLSYTEQEMPFYLALENYMKRVKIGLSKECALKKSQEELSLKAQAVINTVNGKKVQKEEDIEKQTDIVKALIEQGLWPMPGGAWCSAGVPVFEKMSEDGSYPIYKHYDFEGNDVTKFANLDCQTPYYFAYLESGKLNDRVVEFYTKYLLELQKDYNFDGFRVDHIDHVSDKLSEQDGLPISYRIPRKVLGMVNEALKKQIPYFATLAEYMLWDDLYDEYHKDMHFDLLWGNDIISQSSKTPKQIIEDNSSLENYNREGRNTLSFLKTYNNQDGEFEAIDRYPSQLGREGALYKWFKYKFLPGGEYANRPMLYVDGDESFTETGIERVIGADVSMIRGKDKDFYDKFNAINNFAQNSKVITNGKAELLVQEDDGFCVWNVNSNFGSYLVISNYKNPKEKMEFKNENGDTRIETVYGASIYNKKAEFQGKSLKSYFEFEYDEFGVCNFVEKPLSDLISNEITMGELRSAEFKVYSYQE